MRPWVSQLDSAICAEPRLAELGGRFWFSLDDGRADVSGLGADVGVHALDEGLALLLAGRDTGIRLSVGDPRQQPPFQSCSARICAFWSPKGAAFRYSPR